jgi:hypothetical protein
MAENKNTDEFLIKKEWHLPELFQLDFRKTMGGDSPANYEDAFNNNPTSGL